MNMIGIRDIISGVAIVIFIVLSVIFITQLILKLIGGSPSDIQILYIGFGAIVSYLFIMSYKIGYFIGETKQFMRTNKEFMTISKNTFRKFGEKIEEIEKNLK